MTADTMCICIYHSPMLSQLLCYQLTIYELLYVQCAQQFWWICAWGNSRAFLITNASLSNNYDVLWNQPEYSECVMWSFSKLDHARAQFPGKVTKPEWLPVSHASNSRESMDWIKLTDDCASCSRAGFGCTGQPMRSILFWCWEPYVVTIIGLCGAVRRRRSCVPLARPAKRRSLMPRMLGFNVSSSSCVMGSWIHWAMEHGWTWIMLDFDFPNYLSDRFLWLGVAIRALCGKSLWRAESPTAEVKVNVFKSMDFLIDNSPVVGGKVGAAETFSGFILILQWDIEYWWPPLF